MKNRTGRNLPVLMITHHMEECIGADRLIVMSDGLIAAEFVSPGCAVVQTGERAELSGSVVLPACGAACGEYGVVNGIKTAGNLRFTLGGDDLTVIGEIAIAQILFRKIVCGVKSTAGNITI